MRRVLTGEAAKPHEGESAIDHNRRLAVRHGVEAWALIYVGDAIRELATAVSDLRADWATKGAS